MLQCCGVGGGASTAPQAPQLQGTGSAVGATTSTRTTIMQDAVLESILEVSYCANINSKASQWHYSAVDTE